MIQRNFEAIPKAEVDTLIANRVTEIKSLEYKQELPGGTDDQKKEFLADVSSFANVSGGDIILGVKEERDVDGNKIGAPESVIPISATTADEAKLRLENLIQI